VLALCRYCSDPQMGIDMLNAIKGPQPLSAYEQQFLRNRLSGKKYVPFSYFAGATVQNNYTPTTPLTITIKEDSLQLRRGRLCQARDSILRGGSSASD